MVPTRKVHSSAGNSKTRDVSNMPPSKKDNMDRPAPNAGRGQNGNRSGFRTDGAISNNRMPGERALKPWVPDIAEEIDGSLEKSSTASGPWDQFAENEKRFGLTTDYDENIYTTVIDKSHPKYRERMAAAERVAREIERTAPTTAHVAEERIMDFTGGADDQGGDEEDKYSGVRREPQPLASRENKYTPPAKRAPSAQATVVGAPFDPAIIASQIKGAAPKRPQSTKPEDKPSSTGTTPIPTASAKAEPPKKDEAKPDRKVEKPAEAKSAGAKAATDKPPVLGARPTGEAKNASPQPVRDGAPSATETVERDVLESFKTFATEERLNAERARSNKIKADKEVRLTELRKFAKDFKLSTPVPNDLIGIITKDPAKQKEIRAKAIREVEETAKTKPDTKPAEVPAVKPAVPKQQTESPALAPIPTVQAPPADAKTPARQQHVHHNTPSTMPNRQSGPRQPYNTPNQYGAYRNDRNQPHGSQNQTRHLGQRLRNLEQQKMSQALSPHHPPPPSGPGGNVDHGYNGRRLSGVSNQAAHKLNPNSAEFRPNMFAPSFHPGGQPSTGSSPRSATTYAAADNHPQPSPQPTLQPPAMPVSQLVRRKTKAIDVKKCYILSHVKTILPPPDRTWADNGGLRPAYDMLPTWRQLRDDEPPESTMRLTYKEYFDRSPFGHLAPTPNPPHVIPHQHQLPFHLQPGPAAPQMVGRHGSHASPMPMNPPQGGHSPRVAYSNMEDNRMMHSNSAQSFASPRMGHIPVAYPPAMNSPAHMQYSQPIMQPYPPQMPMRSFSNNPQYMPQQPHMTGHPMMQPQYVAGPQGMVGAVQPMHLYPQQLQFIPSVGSGAPAQHNPASSGYPSPNRPAAPVMVQQGSQQGQQGYGMSPGITYQQPIYVPQQPGGPMRGYNAMGPHLYGTSPQQGHQFGNQHRSGSNSYMNKNHAGHVHHQQPPQAAQPPQKNQPTPPVAPARVSDHADEAK